MLQHNQTEIKQLIVSEWHESRQLDDHAVLPSCQSNNNQKRCPLHLIFDCKQTKRTMWLRCWPEVVGEGLQLTIKLLLPIFVPLAVV